MCFLFQVASCIAFLILETFSLALPPHNFCATRGRPPAGKQRARSSPSFLPFTCSASGLANAQKNSSKEKREDRRGARYRLVHIRFEKSSVDPCLLSSERAWSHSFWSSSPTSRCGWAPPSRCSSSREATRRHTNAVRQL